MLKKLLGTTAASLLLLSIFSAGAAEAQAQSLKVGYTDHEVIIVNMPQYRQVREQLQQEYQGGQAEIQSQFQDYQTKLETYQKQQALLTEERRAEREQELVQLQTQIQEAAAQKDQQLAEKEAELMQPLLSQVQDAIDAVAQEKGLDIVLRTQVAQQPVILYINPETITDITPDVARRLGLDVSDNADASN
jgi:outer membrane protein